MLGYSIMNSSQIVIYEFNDPLWIEVFKTYASESERFSFRKRNIIARLHWDIGTNATQAIVLGRLILSLQFQT
jgi:hypothetical protein